MSVARSREARLIEIFSRLPPAKQEELIGIADLLGNTAVSASCATDTATPAGPESVIGALRRLRRAYPGIDRRSVMVEACDIVAEHALNGCAASEAIARLERLFVRQGVARVAGDVSQP